MKSIIIASLISLGVTLGGYVGLVKFSADKKAKREQAAAEAAPGEGLAALEGQLQVFEEQKAAMVGLQASYDAVRENIDIARDVLVAEQQKLMTLHDDVSAAEDAVAEQNEASLAKVAKLYEQMKPAEAARIASQLSDELLVEIIPRMKERSAGKLLSAMESKRAAEISRLIAARQTGQS